MPSSAEPLSSAAVTTESPAAATPAECLRFHGRRRRRRRTCHRRFSFRSPRSMCFNSRLDAAAQPLVGYDDDDDEADDDEEGAGAVMEDAAWLRASASEMLGGRTRPNPAGRCAVAGATSAAAAAALLIRTTTRMMMTRRKRTKRTMRPRRRLPPSSPSPTRSLRRL